MARMVVTSPDYVKSRYNLKALKSLETLVADAVQVNIPVRNKKSSLKEDGLG